MRSRELYSLLLILVLTSLALWIDFAPDNNFLGRDVSTRLGLDLQGGIQVLLRSERAEVTSEEMQTAAGVLERRVNALGVGETVVQIAGNDRIIVELPGVDNPDQAVETLRGTGQLEFIDPQGQYLPNGQIVRTTSNPEPTPPQATQVITDSVVPAPPTTVQGPVYNTIAFGEDLDTNAVQPAFSGQGGPTGNRPSVAFAFRGESQQSLARFTAQNVGQPMCIVLDNVIVSCPVIDAPLNDGSGIITTNSNDDRDRIYNQLKFGALPVPLQVETNRSVTATLGNESVRASFIAGVVGLTVVALFMILFYRLPGVIAVVALLIYTAISFALYRLIPITLTLAGIAGFILSIGLAVDANVLIFARLREEYRRRKDLRAAIEPSFKESWPAIRDSSVSTLITSAILLWFGSNFGVSIIRGFAITLGLGVLLSLFTAVVMTRTFLRLIVPLGIANNPWLFALDRNVPKPIEVSAEPETV
ncbi:MAG: protein translocase subunit SecD [Chloroflexales bacterium]|nr:protein translocase subunit SecD [Chloroflexales bacterium]